MENQFKDKHDFTEGTPKGQFEFWISRWSIHTGKSRELFKALLREKGEIKISTNEISDDRKIEIAKTIRLDLMYFNTPEHEPTYL